MTNNTCKNCRFGKREFDGSQQLEAIECHKNAPTPITLPDNYRSLNRGIVWPLMYPDDFCGQHQI